MTIGWACSQKDGGELGMIFTCYADNCKGIANSFMFADNIHHAYYRADMSCIS